MPVVFQNITLIILYFVAGQGAWLLAIPPYYASLFWPSAGIALAFVYLYGYRLLPGVFLGAGLLAIFSPVVDSINSDAYFSGFGLGLGAMLQALLGVYALRVFFGRDTRFHNLRSVFLFSALAALSCFVSASIAFATFYLRGIIDASGFLGFWQPWVVGDILGVLVVAPLLVLLLNYESVSRKRKLAVCIPAIVLFVSILALFSGVKAKDFQARQNEFQRNVALIERDLKAEFDLYRHEMEAVHSFYRASTYVDRDEFDIFVTRALEENKGIHAIGWAPYILDSGREAFLEKAQNLYDDGYTIKTFVDQGGLRDSPRKDSYTPIYYVVPYAQSKGALGADLMSSPVRRDAIEEAKMMGQITASEPIQLVSVEEGGDKGFIMVQSVYRNTGQKDLEGFLVGAFQYSAVISHVMSAWEGQGVDLLLKVENNNQMEGVYHTREGLSVNALVEGFVVEVPFQYANQDWLFCFYVHPDFFYKNINFVIWYVLIAALLCLYFAIVFLLMLTGQAATMEEAIAGKTQEIFYKNKFLNIIMDSVPDLIFVKDKNFNIVQANQAFFEKYEPDKRDNILGSTGLEQFPKDEQDIYLLNDRKALDEGLSEVEETITDYRGITRTLLTRKARFYDDNNEPFLLGYGRDITDFLSAQTKLETILDTTADGLITIRENGIVETYNKACETIFGYKAEEIIGKNVNILMPEDHARDHGAYLDRYLRTGEKQIIGKGREVLAKRKDGSVFPVDLSVAEVQLGGRRIFSGVLRDITERKRAEELSQQIAQIFNNATIEFYIFDAETYELLFVNEGAITNMGYSEDEFIGRRPYDFVEGYKEDRFYDIKEALLSEKEERFEYETRHVRKDGSEYDVLASIQLTQFDGRPAFIASALDITERNKVVGDLKRSNNELENFAYVTSHDLKAPLRHVSMSAGFFKEKFGNQLDDESKDLLETMLSGTERMQNMIESLLVYSRVGRDDTKFTKVNLNDSVLAARQNLSQEIFTNSAVIENDFLPTIKADRSLMIQLFQNLIQNAIKYRQVDVPPHIKISVIKRSDSVDIRVSDNGIGIDPAYADKVFQIFQRLHRDNEYEGVGIGLSICQRIVEFHGGSISLDKKYSDGTRIVFTLPVNKH